MEMTTVDSCMKKRVVSDENQSKLTANRPNECAAKLRVEDILSKCQEKNHDRVFEIDFHASKLTRIENCQSFPKLRILDLSCNQIRVVRGLEKNLDLKELKLYSNRISKVEGLEKLKELCSLHLQDNNISKLDNGLRNLKKLKSLRLDCNKILSISVTEIASCSKLTYLNVSQNSIEDISFVNCLPLLEEFYATHNKIKKIPDLGRCKKLQELDLSYNQISSLSGMSTLLVVSVIRLEHNLIKRFDVTGILKTVEELYLGCNQLSNVKKLSTQFPSLEVLDIRCNAVGNLEDVCSMLQGCDMIRELNISDNPCTRTDHFYHPKCVKSLPGLEVLDGITVKRPQSSLGRSRPPMRPVSASQMFSTKQLEEQVTMATQEQASFESLISSKFDIVYDLLNKLPEKQNEEQTSPRSRPSTQESKNSQDSPRPSSRCSNRARIKDAIAFAEQHFDQT